MWLHKIGDSEIQPSKLISQPYAVLIFIFYIIISIMRIMLVNDIPYKTIVSRRLDSKATRISTSQQPNKQSLYPIHHTNIDVIYISGGNTFGTLDKIRKCNFDKDIINYVKSGVVYIGGSAGAHIASKDIKHVEKYDENNVGITDYSGLGLFNGMLICHYTDERKADFEKLSANSEYKVYALTDEDSLVL